MIKFLLISILISICLSEFLVTNDGVCTCDLISNVCDIGCCCDKTCTNFQLQSFTCSNTQISPISYGCLPVEVFFGNNTSYKIYNDGSQMCIYYDNYTLRNFYYAPNTTYTTNYYTDSVSSPISYTNFNPISTFNYASYSYGSNIYTFQNYASIGYLSIALPNANDNSCIDGVAIQYLQSQYVQCTRNLQSPINATECAKLPGVDLYNKPNLFIASFPSAILAAYNYSANLTSSGNFIAPIITCNAVPCNLTNVTFNSSNCDNVVTAAEITISGETSITGVNIALTVGSVNTSFNQISSVTFNKIGYNPKASQYSGNPGYIIGKPLIAIYNSSYNGDWLIPNGGSCSSSSKSSISFGYNIETDCFYNVSNENTTIVSALNSLIPASISSFGNTKSFTAEKATVYSSNVSTGSNTAPVLQKQSIYIAYARNGTLTLPQNKIVGVQVNNTFSDNLSNATSIYVSISVNFIDVSQTSFDVDAAVIKSRSGRSVRDFLYLLYVENQAVGGIDMKNCYLLLSISLLFIVRSYEI